MKPSSCKTLCGYIFKRNRENGFGIALLPVMTAYLMIWPIYICQRRCGPRKPTDLHTEVLVLEGHTCLHPNQPFFIKLTLHLPWALGDDWMNDMSGKSSCLINHNLFTQHHRLEEWVVRLLHMFRCDLPILKLHDSWDKHAEGRTLTLDLFWETGRTLGDVPCVSGQSAERSNNNQQNDIK